MNLIKTYTREQSECLKSLGVTMPSIVYFIDYTNKTMHWLQDGTITEHTNPVDGHFKREYWIKNSENFAYIEGNISEEEFFMLMMKYRITSQYTIRYVKINS